MKATLIQGLNEKGLQAFLNKMTLNEFYFPTLFPFKFTPTLTWKALAGEQGVPVAADVIAFDSRAPRKTREIVERLQGDIPKIAIARDKTESELNEYFQLLNYAQTVDGGTALLDWVFNDVEFCFKGVNARLEWLALQAVSQGVVSLSKTNNAGLVTETAVDFLIPTGNKSGCAIPWATSATAVPITKIKAIVKAAKAAGYPIKFILMNQDTFDDFLLCTQVIEFAATWLQLATSTSLEPNLEGVNAAMARAGLPQIKVIDTYVNIEINGTRTAVNPFADHVAVFVPELVLGNTFYAPLAEDQVTESVAVKARRGATLVKKFSTEEPLTESTVGMANAFPALGLSSRMYLVDTKNATWLLGA
ncbi:MAG: major capsid protein [Parcubacteria group bacterium]|jgi:hypothetical protein